MSYIEISLKQPKKEISGKLLIWVQVQMSKVSMPVNGEDWCWQNTLISFDPVIPVPFFDIGISL